MGFKFDGKITQKKREKRKNKGELWKKFRNKCGI
jgi:hypothetical protein